MFVLEIFFKIHPLTSFEKSNKEGATVVRAGRATSIKMFFEIFSSGQIIFVCVKDEPVDLDSEMAMVSTIQS